MTFEECTLRDRKGQYGDKIGQITYRIPNVHTEKENGKCRNGRRIARALAHVGGTNERKGTEENKRARVYVRGKPGKASGPRSLHENREDTGEQIQ